MRTSYVALKARHSERLRVWVPSGGGGKERMVGKHQAAQDDKEGLVNKNSPGWEG